MAGTDVQRLLLQVDASVELARRNMKDLANAIDRDSAQIDDALGKVENAHKRMGAQLGKTGQFRGGMQQLSFQIGDVSQQLALGTKTSTIFIQQSGQVIQALQLMNTGTSGFLKFLSGPWGIALTTASVLLAAFAGKLFDNKDAIGALVDKMRDQAHQADLNRQADEAWKKTVEGVTEAIRKRREEQEKAIQTDAQAQRQSLLSARNELDKARGLASGTRGELTGAEGERDAAKRAFTSIAGTGREEAIIGAGNRIAAAEARVKSLKQQLIALEQGVEAAEQNVRGAEASIGATNVENKLDAVKAATAAYDQAFANLNEQRRIGIISEREYERRLEAEKKKLKEVEEAAKGAAAANRQFGRQIDFGQAKSIAQSAGLQVNSAYRSNAAQSALYHDPAVNRPGNPVAPPGASAHNGANGKWAIDIQITDGVSPGKIRKIFADQGVTLSKVLKEKGHFHVEGSRSEAAAAENASDKAADKALGQDDQFKAQLAQLQQQELAAQMELVSGVQAQADYAKQQVDLEQSRYETALENDVHDGRLREEQAQLLIEKSQAVSLQKKANIDARAMIQKLEEQQRTLDQQADFQIESLRYLDEIAKTQDEHRRIQLQIIDALYAQREADLKLAKAKAEAANNAEEAARIQAQIDQLPTEQGRDRDRALRSTRSPFEEWADKVPQTGEEMSQFFDQLKVQGIDGAIDSIVALGDGFESFRQTAISAIKAVLAELIRLQLMKLALNIFGAASGAGGGGASLAADNSALDSLGAPGVFAAGGFVSGAGSSTSDSIPAMLSNGEFVMNAGAVNRFGLPFLSAINSGRMPHAKGGGLMSLLGGGLFGLLGGAVFGHDSPLRDGIPGSGLWLGRKIGPAGLLGKLLGFADGGLVRVPSSASIPRPANGNAPLEISGHTFNIYVTTPNTGDPLRDKASAMQLASAARREVAMAVERR